MVLMQKNSISVLEHVCWVILKGQMMIVAIWVLATLKVNVMGYSSGSKDNIAHRADYRKILVPTNDKVFIFE